MTVFFADLAYVGGTVAAHVRIDVTSDRITTVTPDSPVPDEAIRLRGLTMPSFANAHSHTFHRALRGHTHRGGGTFWTWRQDMYALAATVTPDEYYELALATYAEMALAGISNVGEFHYLHHGPGGRPYDDPNAMGTALVAAAADAGIRITLLDTCYLTGGLDQPLSGPQLRFGDGSAQAWVDRIEALAPTLDPTQARLGAAIHSVRAVPADHAAEVASWATSQQAPLHFHLSEQRAENEACLDFHGATPTQVLLDAGALTPRSTAVHATHLTDTDINALTAEQVHICMTPTTERDLADGIGPARELATRGSVVTLGSDSNAVIDMLEEARGLEMDERLRTERRGHWTSAELIAATTASGHASLGWSDSGRISPGALADLTTVSLDSVRMSGWDRATLPETTIFAATAADVSDVVVGGRRIVADGQHVLVPDAARRLHRAVSALR